VGKTITGVVLGAQKQFGVKGAAENLRRVQPRQFHQRIGLFQKPLCQKRVHTGKKQPPVAIGKHRRVQFGQNQRVEQTPRGRKQVGPRRDGADAACDVGGGGSAPERARQAGDRAWQQSCRIRIGGIQRQNGYIFGQGALGNVTGRRRARRSRRIE